MITISLTSKGRILRISVLIVLAFFICLIYVQSVAAEKMVLAESDRQDILDLISQYGYTYDSKDIDAFASLFTEDGVWTGYLSGGSKLWVKLKGREKLRKFWKPRVQGYIEKGLTTRHYQTNTIFTKVGDGRVEGTTMHYVTLQKADEKEPRMVHTGYYKDVFVKTKDGWKFSHRVAYIDHK